jgi:hypothetical protein
MKIAIFGDSWGIHGEDYPWPDSRGPSWVDLLRQHYTIDNFCVHGNSIQNVYYEYLKNRYNYDKIITLITSPQRFTVPRSTFENSKFSHVGTTYHINYSKVNYEVQEHLTDELRTAFNGYYKYIYNEELVYSSIFAILNDIINSGKCIVVPCFRDSVPSLIEPWHAGNDLVSLDQASELWIDGLSNLDHALAPFWNKTIRAHKLIPVSDTHKIKLYDVMRCHLSEENNFVLYKLILDAIKRNNATIKLDKSSFFPPTRSFEHYFAVHNVFLVDGQWINGHNELLSENIVKTLIDTKWA